MKIFIVKVLRKFFSNKKNKYPLIYNGYVDLIDQMANDYVYDFLSDESIKGGKMICKFGTVELGNVVAFYYHNKKWNLKYIKDILNYNASFDYKNTLKFLCQNAGFFPYDKNLGMKYCNKMITDMSIIDILGSYIYQERYVNKFLTNVRKRINLNGYYAPFLWNKPWTRFLKGKKVLVIHPFVDSIKYQYENNREKIWNNSDILPEFKELLTIKAVQSIADAKNQPYKDWFEALKYMEDEISKLDFDVALIGCGVYGLCLAAHVKRMGKIAIHLAGWTQMLFGVYGNRWIKDQPEYSKFINRYWIRPNKNERPKGSEKIEGGCYW